MDAAAIKELDRLSKLGGGRLAKQAVVDAARDPSNPLHHLFEWDKDAAHQSYLLQRAGELCREYRVVINVTRSNKTVESVSMFVRDVSSGGRGYVKNEKADQESRRAELEHDLRSILGLTSRARVNAGVWELPNQLQNHLSSIEREAGAALDLVETVFGLEIVD